MVGVAGSGSTVTAVEVLVMQPKRSIVTKYVPVAADVAFGMDGLRTAAVKPFGPVQLYVAPARSVTSRFTVAPSQAGPSFVAVTDWTTQVTVVFPVPVIAGFSVSVAVIDCEFGVFSVKPP